MQEEREGTNYQTSRLLTSTPNRIEVYFGVNNDNNVDNSPADINALSVSQTEIISKSFVIQVKLEILWDCHPL